jgi:hypothetical protein
MFDMALSVTYLFNEPLRALLRASLFECGLWVPPHARTVCCSV